jgi:hypothetical protein
MSLQGGRVPFDPTTALSGPARTLYAPISADVPDDLADIVPFENTSGEYPAEGDWVDFGLAADAPTYSHGRETQGLEYQQSSGVLFEKLSEITRTFVAQIAGIEPENIKIVENSSSTIESIAAAAGKSAQKKLPFGSYSSLTPYRIAMVSFRPDGSTVVEESDGTIRPAAVALILPRVVLGAEDSEFSFGADEPTNAPISFNSVPEPELDSGEEHGFWIFEQEGTIT